MTKTEHCFPDPGCRCCVCRGQHCLVNHPGHSHEAEAIEKHGVVGAAVLAALENGLQAKLTAAEARLAHLEAELARWKVCSLCGETMAEPGACSSAERERKEGYESMYEEAMHRAEAAEAKLTATEVRLSQLEAENKELREERGRTIEALKAFFGEQWLRFADDVSDEVFALKLEADDRLCKLTHLEASRLALTEKLTALVEHWRKHAKWEHNRGNESSGESQAYAYGNEHAHDRCAEDLLAALSPVAPEGPKS